ncbi:MAG TPA: hypothetical protein VK395_06190 [Gemmataceae bacterium]|nr:hypothetical protein [Gemmataceae bacterium]
MKHDGPLTFRIPFLRPWLFAVALLSVPALAITILAALAGDLAALRSVLLGWVGVILLLAAPIGLAVSIGRWQVDEHGIQGPNNWFIPCSVAWDEMRSVSEWPIPGYRYLWINTTRIWVVWVPLFLTDMAGFRQAVKTFAAADNPLRRYFRQNRN